ncbi:MAG: hypothetical protein HWN66_14705 [Candidatus Helarchaeota archaeon]|nr:hypothetical protein [Candidatus Helarchaeota archaeon]
MSQVTKCAILLEISSGAAQRLPFSSESLKHDNVVAIMDEINEVIWLWMGNNTGLVKRRGSMRVARSLKAYGHEIGPSIIGRKLKDVIPIDGLKIESDPTEKANFDKVISLFTREHTIKADVLAEFQVAAEIVQHSYYGLSKTQRDDLVAAAIASPSAGDDSRKIEEIVGEFRPSVPAQSSTAAVVPKSADIPKPTVVSTPIVASKPAEVPKPTPKAEILPPPLAPTQTLEIPEDLPAASTIKIPGTPTKAPPTILEDDALVGDVKASIVISSVLSEYTDIFVGVISQEGNKIYTIEGPDGLICKFSLDKSKIQFLPGSWEKIDQEQKRNIQKLFIDRVKKLLGS